MKNNVHIYPSIMIHESRIQKISKTISGLGYFDNIFLLGINDGNLEKKEIFEKNIIIHRLNISEKQWLKTGFYTKVINVFKLSKLTYRFLSEKKPQVIHAHNLASLPVCVLYKLFNKTKIVYDTHEIEAKRDGWSIATQTIAKVVESFLIKFVNVVVVVNDKFKELYKKWYNVDSVRIHNAPFYNKFSKNNYLREKFDIKDTTDIFAYVGVLEDSRGVNYYLDFALKTDLDICFVFIGRILENENHIKSIANKTNKIFIHNPVPQEELYSILRSADYSIQALQFSNTLPINNLYGIGNKFFESAMAGLPMIGGGFLEQSKFIREYNLGVLIQQGDKLESINNAIVKIKKMDRNLLEENCLEFFKKYNWDKESKQIRDYFNNILLNNL